MKDAEKQEEDDLNSRVDIDPSIWDMSEILEVWPVLAWNNEQEKSFNELHAIKRGHTQVQDKAIEDRKWEELEDLVCHNRQADQECHQK